MKIKYAIYQNKIGLHAVEYVDTKKAIEDLPYIKESYLPVIINRQGGYTKFNLDDEKKKGFLKIIEINKNVEPLTREQMYPKNSKNFEYGWISPDGDTFNTGHEGHYRSSEYLCKEYRYNVYQTERELEKKGWVKVTGSWKNGILEKAVYVEDFHITKKQADTLFDLGLYDVGYVRIYVECSEKTW